MVFLADYLVPQIVFLGDSITQYSANFTNGIIPRLQNEYQREFDIVNRGFAGYTSKWVNEIADPVFAGLSAAPIAYSVIALGTADLAKGKQHVSVDDYAVYLENIVEISSSYTNNTIVVGPALADEDLWPTVNGTDFYEYSQAARAVASKAGVPFVDLYSAFHNFFNESATLPKNLTGNSTFNGTLLDAITPSNTTANSTVWFAKRGSPDLGYIANGSTPLNDTKSAINVSKYPASNRTYLGKKGNPKNVLLSQVLIDGLHFNNRGYDIFYKTLKPFFNATTPYLALPDAKKINSTEYLTSYLEKSYLAAELSWNQTQTGTYVFSGYNLSNLTIGNKSYGNVTFKNFTGSFGNYTVANLTNIDIDSLTAGGDSLTLAEAAEIQADSSDEDSE